MAGYSLIVGVDDQRHRTHARRSRITKDTLHEAEKRVQASRRCVVCNTGMVQVGRVVLGADMMVAATAAGGRERGGWWGV